MLILSKELILTFSEFLLGCGCAQASLSFGLAFAGLWLCTGFPGFGLGFAGL